MAKQTSKDMQTQANSEETIHDLIAAKSFDELSKEPWDKPEDYEDVLNPTEYQERLAMDTYYRFGILKTARQNVSKVGDIEDIWNDAEKKVLSYTEESADPEDEEKTNLFIPLTHATIDSILSEWVRQMTSGSVVPSDDPEDEPKALLMDMIVRYVERINNIDKIDLDANYDMLTYGNKIQQIYYKKEKRLVRQPTGVNPDGTIKYTEKFVTGFDNICIENVDLREIYPDDCARQPDFSDARDVVRRKIIPFSTFQIDYGHLINSKYVKPIGNAIENTFFARPKSILGTDVEVLIWTNKQKDFVRTVADGIVLEDKPIPYDHKDLDYCGAGDIKRPCSFWWQGEPELMKYLQEELNTHRNIRSDAAKMSVLRPIFAPASGKLEDDEIIIEPGKIYYYAGIVPPTQMQVGGDMVSSYNEEDRLKDDMTTTTGVDRRPESSGPNEVATSIVSKREATLKRIAKKMYHSQVMLEKRRGWLIIQLILQYYSVPTLVEIVGQENIDEYKKSGQETIDDTTQDPTTGQDVTKTYKKQYRSISVPNKDIKVKPQLDNAGNIQGMDLKIREKNGYTFFNATPELIKGKYDYIVNPDINLPVTKAQELELANMMYDRLITNPVITSPDGKMHVQTPTGDVSMPMPRGILKLTENMLKKNQCNPADFMPDENQDDPMLQQAMKENIAMMQGLVLGPTPLASPDHTMVHNKFMEQNVDNSMPDVKKVFNDHIIGETDFQKQIVSQQAGGSNGTGQPGAPAAPAPTGNPLGNGQANPAPIAGGPAAGANSSGTVVNNGQQLPVAPTGNAAVSQ